MDKLFYNQASQEKLGWEPSWFGHNQNDEDLIEKVKIWQKSSRLKADGLVGPMTYRRVWTERESSISSHEPRKNAFHSGNKHIVHNGKFLPIEWEKVVLWDEPDGLKCKKGSYTDYSGKEDRNPTFFVNHWDVCLSAQSCSKVLNKRGISVHYCIDNDGTIYQLLDTQHKAWQAGGSMWNTKSIGVEISNAYYMKYQNWYVKNGFGERPIAENVHCHKRKLEDHLDFYPVQLEALKALWKAIHIGLGIPLDYPKNSQGELDQGVNKTCEKGKFSGFINHYNLTRKKIDCAGLDIPRLISEIEKTNLYCLD